MQEKEVVKHNQKNIQHVKMLMLQQQQQSNCNVAVSSSWDESLGFGTSGDDFEEEEEEEEEVSCSESSGPPAVPASSENSCSVSNEEVVDYCYGPALKRNVRAWWVTQSIISLTPHYGFSPSVVSTPIAKNFLKLKNVLPLPFHSVHHILSLVTQCQASNSQRICPSAGSITAHHKRIVTPLSLSFLQVFTVIAHCNSQSLTPFSETQLLYAPPQCKATLYQDKFLRSCSCGVLRSLQSLSSQSVASCSSNLTPEQSANMSLAQCKACENCSTCVCAAMSNCSSGRLCKGG